MLARAWSLLLMLLLSSLVLATTVHARELAGPATVECSGAVHDDGDPADGTSDGDGDRAALHHHGNCHAGTFSVPRSDPFARRSPVIVRHPPLGVDRTLRSRDVDPGLRPPAA